MYEPWLLILHIVFITTADCSETAGTFQEFLRERQSVKRMGEKGSFPLCYQALC